MVDHDVLNCDQDEKYNGTDDVISADNKLPNASITLPAAAVPPFPLSKISRAELTFSDRRKSVSSRRVVGKTLKSTGRRMCIATISTITDIMMSITIRMSRMNEGRGVINAITIASTAMGTPSCPILESENVGRPVALLNGIACGCADISMT